MTPTPERSTPTWTTASEIPRVVLYAPHLRRTLATALIVGTILFAINQLDVVMGGHATMMTWVKVVLTYVVPFVVSNLGIVFATQREDAEP